MSLELENLQPGTTVKVKSLQEITATLDTDCSLEGIPFQAEMRKFCGKKLIIVDNIDRIYIEGTGLAGIKKVVLLDGARCTGEAHRGCQRRCLFLFKTDWITTEDTADDSNDEPDIDLYAIKPGEELLPCHGQSCVLNQAAGRLKYRHFRQYTRGINWPMFVFLSGINSRWYLGKLKDSILGRKQPESAKKAKSAAQSSLDLKHGDIVEVKSKKEIFSTLNRRARNRGLAFVGSMIRYCGGRYCVLDNVRYLIDENTNTFRELTDAVMLEDVICTGEYYGGCPRRCYWLWRSDWLKKVSSD